MPKIVVDTNVLIRPLLIPKSSLNWLIDSFYKGRLELVFSPQLIQELTLVLTYDRILRKYHLKTAEIKELVACIYELGILVYPQEKINICRDSKDNFVLEAAVAGNVDYIITGDNDLLVLKEFQGIKIVKPADFRKSLTRTEI